MKLRLPHKFQAALMAAIASVSFTTLSSGTITAAGVAFFGHRVAAQDATDDSTGINIGYADLNEGEDARKNAEEIIGEQAAKTPNEVGSNGGAGNNVSNLNDPVLLGANENTGIPLTLDKTSVISSNAGIDWTNEGIGGPLTSWLLTFSLDAKRDAGDYYVFATDKSGSSAAGHYIKETTDGGLKLYAGSDALTLVFDNVNIVKDGSYAVSLQYVATKDSSGQYVGGEYTMTVEGITKQLSVMKSGSTEFEKGDAGTRFWTNGGNEQASSITLTKLDDNVIGSYTWAATTDGSDWNDSVWESGDETKVKFVSGSDAVFDSTATSTQVNITSTITAHNVSVSGQAYTFNVQDGGSLTASSLSGQADLTKTGAGTMTISGASPDYTGNITVNGGTLAVTQASSLGTGTHTVASGAVIEVTNANMANVGTLTVEGAGTVRLVTTTRSESGNALGTVTAPILELADNSNNTGRYYYGGSSSIAGASNLKFAGGQLWLNSDITYTGGVTFGTTTYTEGNDFAGAAMRVHASGTFRGAVNVQDTTKLVWGVSGKTIEFADAVTGSGGINLLGSSNNTGTFKVSGNASGYAGTMTTDNKTTLNVASGGQLSLAGGSSLAGAVTLEGSLTMNGDTASTISGAISGNGTLTKAGDGTLNLTNTNNSTRIANLTVADGTVNLTGVNGGGTGMVKNTLTIQGGGTLNITNHHDALGWGNNGLQHLVMGGSSGVMATLNLAPSTGATITTGFDLTMNGDAQITGQAFNTLANNGTAITVSGTNNSISGISVRNAVNINTNESAELSIVSLTQYSGSSAAVTKTGTGKLILTGNPTNKTTSVEAGTLVLTSDVTNLGGDLTIGDAATLTLSGSPLSTGGALTFEGGATLDLSNYTFTGTESSVALVTTTGSGSISGPTDWASVNLTFADPSLADKAALDVQNGKLVLTFAQPDPGRDLIWQGGPGEWNTDTANEPWYHKTEQETWELVAFEEGDNVSFSVQTYSPVSLTEDITAGDVTIDKGVEVSLSSGTAGKVDLNADDIVVNGDLTVTNVGVNADEMIINEGGHVTAAVTVEGYTGTMETDVSGSGDVTKAGAGNLALTGDNSGFTGTLTIEEGNVVASSAKSLGDTPNIVLAGGNLAGPDDVVVTPSGNINITSTADGTVSANLEVADGAVLTFNTTGNTTITESGVISGAGDIVKDGTGTLVLSGTNETTGGMDIRSGRVEAATPDSLGSGTIQVDATSTLALTPAQDPYHIDGLNLISGGTIVFAGGSTDKTDANLLDLDTMFLHSSSYLDFSNVTLTVPETGSTKYYIARYDKANWTEAGSVIADGLVQFIAMAGLSGLQPNNIVSLHVDESDSNNKVLYLQVDAPHNGYYWNDRAGNQEWDTVSGNWSSDIGLSDTTKFEQSTKAKRVSAYFMEDLEQTITLTEEGSETSEMGEAAYELHDLVVGAGKYTFKSNREAGHTIHFDTDVMSNIVVRPNAELNFDHVSLGQGQGSIIHVCTGAKLTSRNAPWSVYSLNNEGTVDVSATFSMESMLAHVTNTGDFKVMWGPDDFASIGDISNSGSMTLGAMLLAANPFYGTGSIINDGNLTFDASLGDVAIGLPVSGSGDMYTTGQSVTLSHFAAQIPFYADGVATVSQTSLNIGAAVNFFEEGVQLSEYTMVQNGKEATFYGGTTFASEDGSLGKLTMKAGTKEDPTKVTLGGYYYIEEDLYDDSTYYVKQVIAGENTVFTVENGANATIDSFNAGAIMPERTGIIVVGADTTRENVDPSEYSPAHLVVNGVANADTLYMMDGAADLNGDAMVTTLTQSGGEANFNAGGYVGGGTVSGGTLDIGDGKVLTLGQAIDITENGSYTVDTTTGSINADELELEENMDNAQYLEAVSGGETKTQSGFLEGGQQYVQVFNLGEGATLTGNSVTVTHKDAAGPMTLDNTGRGYLDTTAPVYSTYYVRDNYVTGDPGARGSEKRSANFVKLSNVIEASKGEGQTAQLETVVFDTTSYNEGEKAEGKSGVTGSITVDVQGQHADLFDARTGAVGVVNIGEDTDGNRVLLCCSEDYAGVDGQMKIAGTGIYQIENRGTLGENVSLLYPDTAGIAHWTGTVKLIGSAEGVDTAPLSVGSGDAASEIEFDQWTGSFKDTGLEQMRSNAKILLTGTGVQGKPAISLTEGDANLLWTNTVNGEGARIDHTQDGDFTLMMTGDTSGWNGTFTQSAADTAVSLGFLDNVSASGVQNANVLANAGGMLVEYGGNVKTVNGNATVYGTGEMSLRYTGTGMQVNSNISQYQGQGSLEITVGDGTNAASATFNGAFTDTADATMYVERVSTATINTDAELLRVLGDEGSNVVVSDGKTLSLASANSLESYSQFYGVDNQGTIEMKASGGDIKLVDTTDHEAAFNLGDLELTGDAGTAAIETSGVADKPTNVDIKALGNSGSDEQELKLTNDNATGTVNYNLGGEDSTADFTGKIAYGVNGGNGAAANLVIKGSNTTDNSVLESTFASAEDVATANIVVDTAAAKVLGLSSDDKSANKTMVVSGSAGSNKSLEITGGDDYTYAGKLGANLDITYSGTGSQTIEGGVDGFNGSITVDNGSSAAGVLEILNASSVSITDLTIGANDTLDLNDGTNVGTAVVSGTMKAGGTSDAPSKLDGSLTLGSSSTYDVSASGGTGGLQLTGALTINSGAQLSDAVLAGVSGLGWFGMYDLAWDVDDMSSFGSVDWSEGVDATTVFANTGLRENEYYVRYSQGDMGGNGNNVGAVYIYRIPEPTTGTLSLLALCALAARRRRK